MTAANAVQAEKEDRDLPLLDGKAAHRDCSTLSSNPMMERPLGRIPEEKHEPVSDIDIARVDSLNALDPKRPMREANIAGGPSLCQNRKSQGPKG